MTDTSCVCWITGKPGDSMILLLYNRAGRIHLSPDSIPSRYLDASTKCIAIFKNCDSMYSSFYLFVFLTLDHGEKLYHTLIQTVHDVYLVSWDNKPMHRNSSNDSGSVLRYPTRTATLPPTNPEPSLQQQMELQVLETAVLRVLASNSLYTHHLNLP